LRKILLGKLVYSAFTFLCTVNISVQEVKHIQFYAILILDKIYAHFIQLNQNGNFINISTMQEQWTKKRNPLQLWKNGNEVAQLKHKEAVNCYLDEVTCKSNNIFSIVGVCSKLVGHLLVYCIDSVVRLHGSFYV